MKITTVSLVWYVVGDPDKALWATKEDAEKWVREVFPDEDFVKRYDRIHYRTVETIS